MPLGWGTSAAFTTADPTAGRQYTRLRGPLLVGAQNDLVTAAAGASISPPDIMNVSTMRADLLIMGNLGNMSSSTGTVNKGFVYIPFSTYSLSSSSGTSSGPPPTPTVANAGVAIAFDTITSRLCVFSTVIGEWRSMPAVTSS